MILPGVSALPSELQSFLNDDLGRFFCLADRRLDALLDQSGLLPSTQSGRIAFCSLATTGSTGDDVQFRLASRGALFLCFRRGGDRRAHRHTGASTLGISVSVMRSDGQKAARWAIPCFAVTFLTRLEANKCKGIEISIPQPAQIDKASFERTKRCLARLPPIDLLIATKDGSASLRLTALSFFIYMHRLARNCVDRPRTARLHRQLEPTRSDTYTAILNEQRLRTARRTLTLARASCARLAYSQRRRRLATSGRAPPHRRRLAFQYAFPVDRRLLWSTGRHRLSRFADLQLDLDPFRYGRGSASRETLADKMERMCDLSSAYNGT